MADHAGQHLAQDCLHVAVVVDEPHLGVERDVLGEMAHGVVGLGAEHRPDLVHPLEHADHDLLVQLRALGEERAPAEVVEPEDVRAALRRGTDDLRRLDLGEAERVERRPEPGERRRGDRERGADARDDGATPRRDRAASASVALSSGRRISNGERRDRVAEHRDRRCVQLDAGRRLRRRDDVAVDLRPRSRRAVPSRRSVTDSSVDDDLRDTARVAQQQERQVGEMALMVNPPGDPHAFADVLGELDWS